jgi:hypothetical protein
MRIEIVTPFALPHMAGFRAGEIVNMPDKEAKELIAGKLAKPALEPAPKPEFATAQPQRSK